MKRQVVWAALLALLLPVMLFSPALVQAQPQTPVQPGDLVRILLPGEPSLDKRFEVDRQGRLVLPEVGAIEVAGLDETAMQSAVAVRLKTAFRDLSGLSVFVAERRIRVSVLGYVETPGEVVLPAEAGVQMALRAAGGIRAGAQLDRLQLRRGNEQSLFDYKAYLDSGDRQLLPQLNSLDVLFVPASPKIGNVAVEFDPNQLTDKGDAAEDRDAVKVFGEVNSPGSFSYRSGVTIVDMLMRAGGVTRYASVEQIRVILDGEPRLFNLERYLDSGDQAELLVLSAGTTVFVPKQEEEVKAGANTVYVMGEVFKPGAYEGNADAGFLDVLANAGGPTRFAETRQMRIIRQSGEVEAFDMLAFTEGQGVAPPQLFAGDAIFVPEKTDLNEKSWTKVAPQRAVKVMGEVNRPGRFEWSDEMSMLDLLAHAGGPKPKADTAKVKVVYGDTQGQRRTVLFDLQAYLNGSNEPLPTITAGTVIMVPQLPDDPSDNKSQWIRQASEDSIYIFGQVGAPGRYRFNQKMHFLDILAAADGPTGEADLSQVRINHRDGSHARVTRLDLAMYFETGDEHLLPAIQPGDSIYIPEKQRPWLTEPKERTVRVLGAVNKPGRYRFNDNMTLLDLLAEAGGVDDRGHARKITVVNLSCCRDQARTFDLVAFSQSGDFDQLPVLRAGDTVYVPDEKESTWEKTRQGMEDVFRVLTISALLGFI
ncbi:SLBB domain-containing protein [Ferrimonas marina]|uniref:Protein involved in polysaccharide export, contains SLBB domain of the beta-grasp fold n=1 Tax=Ferrimonas marina TaxID=299255 RepID=A0A1M5RSP9_9GAMM|nr:SLBB domain-containing protein [Ferrimonas marina]SHH29372.1 protein involved in polysaccharide export, contains SLBB domain of the beta-grasp fold [Ferrimonas marina]